jgi:hypothetical protein
MMVTGWSGKAGRGKGMEIDGDKGELVVELRF